LNIELIRAVYGEAGNPKNQMNLLKKLQSYIDLRDYDVAITNVFAGRDPAPGTLKVLIIKYKINGKIVTKTIKENSSIPWE
jgi:hypothetical protein